MKALLVGLFLVTVGTVLADDVIFTKLGDRRSGRIAGFDGTTLRLQVPLPPPPGSPPGATPMFASVSIARADIDRIEFAPDPALDALLAAPGPDRLPALTKSWDAWSPWLGMPRSRSARVGLVLGDVLLRSNDASAAAKALEIFSQIERTAWDEADRMLARQGRLRAMVATGRAAEAVNEAMELAAVTEDPDVLIEAKFILAEADAAALRKLVEDNPRWEEDIYVRPEHARLANAALDLYLYPALFHGSDAASASRGLWGAVEVSRFVGDLPGALERSRDILALYPSTKQAALAREFIASLPKEIQALDAEAEAKADLLEAAPSAASPTPKPETKKKSESPKKKTNEKKPDPED